MTRQDTRGLHRPDPRPELDIPQLSSAGKHPSYTRLAVWSPSKQKICTAFVCYTAKCVLVTSL